MARGTVQVTVAGRQREGRRVREVCHVPRRRRMALGTIGRKTRLYVIGIARALVLGQVAIHTVCGQRSQATLVTLGTVQPAVSAGERKINGVFEVRVFPCRGVVALRAVVGEARLAVIGIRRLLVVVQMTTGARCW